MLIWSELTEFHNRTLRVEAVDTFGASLLVLCVTNRKGDTQDQKTRNEVVLDRRSGAWSCQPCVWANIKRTLRVEAVHTFGASLLARCVANETRNTPDQKTRTEVALGRRSGARELLIFECTFLFRRQFKKVLVN